MQKKLQMILTMKIKFMQGDLEQLNTIRETKKVLLVQLTIFVHSFNAVLFVSRDDDDDEDDDLRVVRSERTRSNKHNVNNSSYYIPFIP